MDVAHSQFFMVFMRAYYTITRNTQWGLTQNPIWNSQNPIQQALYVEILGINSHICSFYNSALINLNFLNVFTYSSGKKIEKHKEVTLVFLPKLTKVTKFQFIFVCRL